MRKTLSKVAAGLAVFLTLSGAAASEAGLMTLHGHVPSIVNHLTAKGMLPPDTDLKLTIGLPVRNQASLSNLLEQIYDPASPNFHKYLTPDQFTAQFGPSEQDYQAVKDFAAAHGLTVTGTYSNRMLLDVTGKASDIQSAFNVTLKVYHHPTENRDFFAPDTDPMVDSSLPIIHVSGLENCSIAAPQVRIRPMTGQKLNASPTSRASGAIHSSGSAPYGNYEGSDFRNAYVPGTTLTGTGQNVALFELDGFYASDIAAYEQQIGLSNNLPQLVTVPVDGGVQVPTLFGNGEVSLDIEMVISMSPGVGNIYVYEGPNSSSLGVYTVFEDVLNRIAIDDLAKQVGCSWGIYGGPDPISEQIFQEMALQGQSFYNASGDNDAFVGQIPFPSDSPNITQVGGTTLTTTGTNATYASETVWNWDVEFGSLYDGEGSSGGVSTTYAIPSWQSGLNMTLAKGSTLKRNVPDVAMTADQVWVIFGSGQSGSSGGTSCAAPLWAGFTALVNQQAAIDNYSPVGFINPAIYSIARGANYTNCFHDITTGNNTWSGSPNLFYAVSNYDLCTGLGTPNGTNLINVLATTGNNLAHISAPLPLYGTNLSVMNGSNPNGTWELFVQDVAPLNDGVISNGYWLNLTTANPVGFAADVELLMSATPSVNVAPGGSATCLLTATNYGPSGSTNVNVSDALPLGATLISSTASAGTVTHSASDIVWNLGNLATNTGASLSFTLSFPSSGNYINSAQVTSETPDPNPEDGSPNLTFVVGTPQPPSIAGFTQAGANGSFLMSISAPTTSSVIIQASTNLVSWINVYTNTPPFVFTNFDSTTYPFRFYRAVTGQ